MNSLRRMFEDQRAFNRMIFDDTKADERSRMERFRSLGLGAIEEVLEFLRTFDYKVHRRSKLRLPNIAHSHEELVDIFKYWLSLVDLTNFPLDKLEELYTAKSRVVQYRYQEEWIRRIEGHCVVVDIDQVLADYITAICDWALSYGYGLMSLTPGRWNVVVERLRAIKRDGSWVNSDTVGVTHLEWQQVKHNFRVQGGKRSIPVFPDAKPFLEWCRSNEWLIILVTSRPVNEYPNIFTDTLTWLHKNQLPFDYVWWANEKGERIEEEASPLLRSSIQFAVDDNKLHCAQYQAKGIHTFRLDRSQNYNESDPTHDPWTVHSLHDLMTRWDSQVVDTAVYRNE